MAKLNLGIDGTNQGVAQAREAWSGDLPPTGSYDGILKILSIGEISQNSEKWAGHTKLSAGVELRNTPGGKYDGYIAWGTLNLIDPSIPFVNQFLLALTDGSDAQYKAIEKGFYSAKPDVDKTGKHILKIGRWNINSPEGQLPIKVSVSNKPFFNEKTQATTQVVRIESYLMGGGAGPSTSNGSTPEVVAEEEVSVELEPEDLDADESILD
jgi:hypothetical protein